MSRDKGHCKIMDPQHLAVLLQRGLSGTLIIDSRAFSEYNASHVLGSINICCSKLVKRRLQQDKVPVGELLNLFGKMKLDLSKKQEVVVYDQSTRDRSLLPKDSFVRVLLGKLEATFYQVSLLTGAKLVMMVSQVPTTQPTAFIPDLIYDSINKGDDFMFGPYLVYSVFISHISR